MAQQTLKKILLTIADLLGLLKVEKNLMIVRIDGGISSQLGFWALGHELESNGYKVKYDISWFIKNGKDANGLFARNFDLNSGFPTIEIPVASDKEVLHYKRRFKNKSENIADVKSPAYLAGYYDRWNLVIKYREYLRSHFQPKAEYFDQTNKDSLKQISKSNQPCAVHVRRGDLANDHSVYGKAVEVDYFLKAIEVVCSHQEDPHFFFFSDELDWVEKEIIPRLSQDTNYTLVAGNGSDKGFMDLYLMSQCQSFISSQGAFAKYACLLHADDSLIVEPSSNALFDDSINKAIVIDNV